MIRPFIPRPWQLRAALDGRLSMVAVPIDRLRGRFGAIRQFGRSDTVGYDWHFRDKEARWHDPPPPHPPRRSRVRPPLDSRDR